MSLFRRDSIGIGIGPVAVAAALAGSVSMQPVLRESVGDTGTAMPTSDASALAASLRDALRDFAGQSNRCQAVLVSGWAREWVMTAPGGLRSLRELKDLATVHFQKLYGDPPTEWLIAANWRARESMLCGAIPRQVYETITDTLRNCGLVAAFTTFASACLDCLPQSRSKRWVCVRTPQSFIVALLDGSDPILLRPLSAEAATSQDHRFAQLADEVERMALRVGAEPPTTIHYCDLAGSGAQSQRLERITLEPIGPRRVTPIAVDSDVSLAACLGCSA